MIIYFALPVFFAAAGLFTSGYSETGTHSHPTGGKGSKGNVDTTIHYKEEKHFRNIRQLSKNGDYA